MRPTILANPPTQYEVITAATIAPVPDGPWLRFPNQNSNASYAFGKAGQEFDISMTIKFLGANGNQRLFGVYNRSVQYGVRVQMTATQIVISDACQAINIAVIAYVMPANGRAVPFRLICKNNTYVIYIDGTRYGPYPFMLESGYASWGGQTPESWLILPVSVDNIGDLYFKDVSIKPVPKAEDFSKVEVIDVGNRRFMCELDRKMKFSDFTLLGATPPTNIGSNDDPVIDVKHTGVAGLSGITLVGTSLTVRPRDDVLFMADIAVMPDESAITFTIRANTLCDQVLATIVDEFNYIILTGAYTDSWSVTNKGSNSTSGVLAGIMGRSGEYHKYKALKFKSLGIHQYKDIYFQKENPSLEVPQGTSGANEVIGFQIYGQSAGGADSVHLRLKNLKFYRVICEMRP